MLKIDQLSVSRGDKCLFENLSFSVKPGDLLQIEGRNGSGKTTLLRILTGLGLSDSGKVYWCDEPITDAREQYHSELLFIGHQTGIKRELTAFENTQFFQHLNGIESTEQQLFSALAKVGLAGREDVPVMHLSAGQQRRVALARLWLSQHKLWILDEPLTAIDKRGVVVLENLFLQHVERGGMLIFTTHQDMLNHSPHLRTINLGEVTAC